MTENDATQWVSNTEVKFYRLTGGDHFTANNNVNLGSCNSILNATTGVLTNDIIRKFFAVHPKP